VELEEPRGDRTAPDSDRGSAERAFLQRGEVRLSTLHRIAGTFLNGAGLLLLFPVFLKDIISQSVNLVLYSGFPVLFKATFTASSLLTVGVPLYSLYLLFRELVQFYFVPHHRPEDTERFIPRFTLTALAFPPDETTDQKKSILERQYGPEMRNFLIPPKKGADAYYRQVWLGYKRAIIPATRDPKAPESLTSTIRGRKRTVNIALGLAGLYDRDLQGEVAKMEFSTARHVVYLRTLVLRYFKALILLIATTLSLTLARAFIFVGAGNVIDVDHLQSTRWIFSAAMVGWAALAFLGVRQPVRWMFQLADQNLLSGDFKFDPELTRFETKVTFVCIVVVVLTVLGVLPIASN
jgi:hypothetical protein